jgi:hypothetical protein
MSQDSMVVLRRGVCILTVVSVQFSFIVCTWAQHERPADLQIVRCSWWSERRCNNVTVTCPEVRSTIQYAMFGCMLLEAGLCFSCAPFDLPDICEWPPVVGGYQLDLVKVSDVASTCKMAGCAW